MILPLIIAAIVFVITLWRREYGLGAVILLWPAYLLRTTILGIPTTALELAIYGLAAGVVISLLRERTISWPSLPRWYHVLGAAWIVAWIIATVFSTDHHASLGAFKAWLVDPILFGSVMLLTIRTDKQRAVLLQAAAVSGTIVAVAGVIQLAWFRDTLQDNRLSSFFHPVANYAAMYLAPLLVMSTGTILWKQLNRWWWVAAGVMAVALALTVSFGGYLSAGIGLLMLWWYWPDRRMKKVAAVSAIAAALLGALVLSQTPYLSEKFKTTDRSSGLVRSQIWRTSVEMIKEHPVIGIGPNAYEPIYRQTVPKLYWPPLEWLVSQPHQLYLALWLETGLLGLAVLATFCIFWIRWLWPRMTARDGATISAVAAMLAILIHGFVDTPMFKNDLMLLTLLIILLPLLDIPAHRRS